MQKLEITICVTDEELKKLATYVNRTEILKLAGCHVPNIVDTIADRVIRVFLSQPKKVIK